MSAADFTAAIARFRREMEAACDALECHLAAYGVRVEITSLADIGRDRNTYQRQYMRDVRAAKKLGMTTGAYRAQKFFQAE